MMGAPHPVISPMRAANLPPISTVKLPVTMVDGGCGPASGGKKQACASPTQAAGRPPIKTLGTPGPAIIPGCPVASRTRAAGGTDLSLINVHGAADDVDFTGGNIDSGPRQVKLPSAYDRDSIGTEIDKVFTGYHLNPCRREADDVGGVRNNLHSRL